MTIERDKRGRFIKGGHKNPKSYTWKKGYQGRKGLTKENNESVRRQSIKISKILKRLYKEGKRKTNSLFKPYLGEKHHNWKGNNIGYWGVHSWINRKYGQPKLCDICNKSNKKRYEWANKSGKYLRIRNDWIRLCVKCHRKNDLGIKNV